MKFYVVVVGYFTKWIEVEPLAAILAKDIHKFVWKNIICKFGMSRVIVADNGSQFMDKGFQEFTTNLRINLHFTPVAHAQSNGQVEVSNRMMKDYLKNTLKEARGKWLVELSSVLWSYRTTARKVTRETPFTLNFSSESSPSK